MGCSGVSDEVLNSPFNICITTIINSSSSIYRIYLMKNNKILIISAYNFRILDMKTKEEETLIPFSSPCTFGILIEIPDLKMILGKPNGDIEILHMNKNAEKILSGHTAEITYLLLLSNNKLCSSSADGDIFIWTLPNNNDDFNFSTGKSPVIYLYELDDCRLLTLSKDNTAKIFDLDKQKCDAVIKIVKPYCLIQLKNKLLVYNSNKDICFFDLKKLPANEKTQIIGNNYTNIISSAHDGQITYLIELKSGHLASAGKDYLIKIWDLKSLELLMELKGHSGQITYMIDTIDRKLYSCGDDQKIKIWVK